jgi:NADPH-dependent 7-cyano-7-deazaguanine reductase QueF-like protein
MVQIFLSDVYLHVCTVALHETKSFKNDSFSHNQKIMVTSDEIKQHTYTSFLKVTDGSGGNGSSWLQIISFSSHTLCCHS